MVDPLAIASFAVLLAVALISSVVIRRRELRRRDHDKSDTD